MPAWLSDIRLKKYIPQRSVMREVHQYIIRIVTLTQCYFERCVHESLLKNKHNKHQ